MTSINLPLSHYCYRLDCQISQRTQICSTRGVHVSDDKACIILWHHFRLTQGYGKANWSRLPAPCPELLIEKSVNMQEFNTNCVLHVDCWPLLGAPGQEV